MGCDAEESLYSRWTTIWFKACVEDLWTTGAVESNLASLALTEIARSSENTEAS